MKQLLLPLVFVCTLTASLSFAQTHDLYTIFEGVILSFPTPNSMEFEAEDHHAIKTQLLLKLPESKIHLRRMIKKFQDQRWQVFVRNSDGVYEIVSIYGLGKKGVVEEVDRNPPPIFKVPDIHIGPTNPSQKRAISTEQAEIVRLTNIERWDNGMKPPLKNNDLIHSAAQGHTWEMANDDFFAHCDLDSGTSPGDRVTSTGYYWNAVAENIAAGSNTAADAMAQWMGSSGHRNNILSSSYRAMGAGYAYDGSSTPSDRLDDDRNCVQDAASGPYYHYWTQNFGRRNNIYPLVINREEVESDSRTVALYVYGTPVSPYESYTAVSMRFSNDNQNWSAWETYSPDKTWELSPGNGTKTVFVQIRNAAGSVKTSSDEIILDGMECPSPMTFSNETLSGTHTYTDCEIIADPNVLITGDITFEATQVTLGVGVEVQAGAVFEIMMMN